MKRGKLSNEPCPRWFIDWKCIVPDLSFSMKLMLKVVEDTLFFKRAAQKIPVDRKVLHWVTRNYEYAFDVIVVGKQTRLMDQLLAHRLKAEWIQEVYYFEAFELVLKEMETASWIMGALTKDKHLIDPSKQVYEFTGHRMNLKQLPVFTEVIMEQ